jgi:hypothetical protein
MGGIGGVVKTPENLYDAGSYHVRQSGLVGAERQQMAQAETIVFNHITKQAYNYADDLAKLAIENPRLASSVAYDLTNNYGPQLGGMVTGGYLRGQYISSSLTQLGMSPRAASGVGLAVGVVNIYGSARGEIHSQIQGSYSSMK